MTIIDELNERISSLEIQTTNQLIVVQKEKEKYDLLKEKLDKLHEEREQQELAPITIENVDWLFLLCAKKMTKQKYKKLQELLRYLCSIYGINRIHSLQSISEWVETNQQSIQIALIQGDDIHTQGIHNVLNILIPYIEPWKSDGYKHIKIFEKSLSFYRSYHLVINNEGLGRVWTSDERDYPTKEWGSLKDTLAYIQENIWQEKRKRK